MGQQHDNGGQSDVQGVDWFKWLDIAVWAAVIITVGLCVEWLFGGLARESVAAGAERFLRREAQPEPAD